LVSRLVELRRLRPLTVALEPTGTYGDALRQSLGDAGLSVQRVSGKASRDYSEVFDGVPSSHDGKDATVVAELAAIGKGRSWPTPQVTDWEARLEQWVTWLDGQQDIQQLWLERMAVLRGLADGAKSGDPRMVRREETQRSGSWQRSAPLRHDVVSKISWRRATRV